MMVESSYISVTFIFFGWTISSFICHFYAKLYLMESTNSSTTVYKNVLYLTGIQILLILLSIHRENKSKDAASIFLILAAHAFATLSTNWSIAISHAASTFAIKLMEPLTSAIVQRLIIGVRLTYTQCLSIPLVIFGAIVFADDSNKPIVSISLGSIFAFLSNIFLAFRNVYIKQKHFSNTNLLRYDKRLILDSLIISIVEFVFLILVTQQNTSFKNLWHLYSLVTVSVVFHTVYTYISTDLVLKHFSVVGHAFGNILKRLFVIALLYTVGSKSASTWNFIGLIICITGLLTYAVANVESSKKDKSILRCAVSEMATVKNIFLPASVVLAVVILSIHFNQFSSCGYEKHSRLSIPTRIPSYLAGERIKLDVENYPHNVNFSIEDFYATDLTQHPEKANKLSRILTKRVDVINEAQRIHMNIFRTLLKGYKFAMLFDYSPSENKGDSAIAVGEAILLRKFNIEIIFACSTGHCGKHLVSAENLSKNFTSLELVILLHGGGNIIGYHQEDKRRFEEIPFFKAFHIIMFPQSIFYREDKTNHIELCKTVYSSHPKLTFIWRDSVSYSLGKKLFPKVQSLLSPDIAYQLGPVQRFMDPTLDILWIKRTDAETPGYKVPDSVHNFRMHVADWISWNTPKGTSPMENTFLMTANGMMFLLRGRVVITDRLHGYILCTLLDIPHIFIDNKQHKLLNYHNTWTRGLENVIFASSPADALIQANYLLKKLDNKLPQISGYYNNTGH